MKNRKSIAGIFLAATVTFSLAACTPAATGPTVDPDAPVTISVSNQPPATQEADLKAYKQLIADFEAEYPNITVEGREQSWDAATYQAQLAGGQLPTVVVVPFTEPQGLIDRGQVADITSELDEVGLTDKLNPAGLSVAENADGHIFGVPVDAYALGLVYNRDLFTQAGLDPDNPPATWDDVRAAAKKISAKTGATGYAQMTSGGQGGWMLTALTYSAGGTIENADGTEATFTDGPTEEQLQLLHDMRWEDNSMGSNFTYDQAAVLQDFAAGKVGMVVGAPISYIFTTTLFGMDGSVFGLGSMPQGSTAGGSLSGGALQVVSPTATPAERLAAVKFIEFRLRNYTDKDRAVAYAQSQNAAGQPVGLPGLFPLTDEYRDQYLEWVADYINVPLDQFAPYLATINDIVLTPEPAKDAQEVYAALDPVVQTVLTQQDVDISALLDDAAANVNALLKR